MKSKLHPHICTLILIFLTFSILPSFGEIFPGPENSNLRLQLTISNNDTNSKLHIIRIRLINTDTSPVKLISEWKHKNATGDYMDYMKEIVTLSTFPEVLCPAGQTFPLTETSIETLQANIILSHDTPINIHWEFDEDKWLIIPSKKFCFASDGLYYIRAFIQVKTDNAEIINLYSNEQPLIIGDKLLTPKPSSAKIIDIDKIEKSILINKGSNNGIERNDLYLLQVGMSGWYTLRIDKALKDSSIASFILKNGQDVHYPKKGTQVLLWRESR